MIMSLPRKTIAFNRLFQFFALSLSVLPRIHSKGIRGAQIIHRGDLIGDDQVLKNVFSLSLSEVNHPPRDRRNQADNPTNDLQYDFLESCQAALKSEKIVDDGVISQSDFTNFIFDRCLEDKLCKKKDKLKFEHLEVNIQLKFINGVCSQEDSDVRVNCILGLEEMWNNGGEFGLKLSEVNDAMLDDLVEGLCEETYVDVGKMGLIKTWEPIFTPSLFPHFEPNYPATLPQIHVGDPSPEPSTLHPTLSPSIGPAKNTATYNPSYTEPTFKPSLLPTFEPNDPPTPPQILTGVQSPKPSSHYLRSTIGPTFLVSTAPTYNPYHAEPSFIQSSFHTSEPTNTPTLRSNNTGVPSLKAPLLNRTSSPLILSTNTPSYNPARSSRPTSNAPTFSSSTSSPTQPFIVIPDIEEEGEGGTLGPTLNPTALTMLNPLPVRFPTDAANHAYSKQFATECFSYLLSPELLSDDLISQNDFSQFITYHCIQMELCEEGTMLTFEELDVSLQITFILGVCSEDDEESRMTCIDDLRVMWNSDSDFGFDVDLEDIDTLLWNLCANSYGDLLQMGLTTSEAPTITFTPNPSVVPSRAPINEKDQVSFASSTAPSFLSQSQSPNFDLIEVVDDDGDSFKAPETTNRNSSFPVGAIAGATFAAACLLVAACIVSKCRNRYKSSASLNEQYFSKNANHYGTLLQPWDGPLPLAYDMSSNRSWLSTSSSFRDLRFVNVFAPDGVSIPQFNPNTTGAVVIGSVTIGASSSSCSSHFSRNDESSPKSHSYVTIGRIACQADKIQLGTRDNGSGYSSKDDVSSLSSSKSSIACKRSTRRSKLSSITNDTDDKNSILAATSLSIGSRSTVSRRTMPLSRAQRKKMTRKGVSYHREVSFADWKAVSFMSNEVYHFNQATDSAAAIKQKSFFFDVFTSNVSTSSSCEDPLNDLSSQSLKISPRVAGIFPSHNNASSLQSASRLSTADTSSHIDTHRKTMSTNSSSSPLSETNQLALFSQLQNQYIISPDTQSISNEDSDVSSTKIPTPSQPWSNKSFSLLFAQKPKLSTLRSIGFKSMIAACTKEKTKMKRRLWRNRSYHMISGDIGLEEDQSVASMKSYSSRINLLPTGEFAFTARTSLPNILLGTFAAAAVPIGDRTMPLARWKEAENELTTYNVHQEMGSSKLEVRHDEANPNSTDTTFCQPEITPQDSARGDPDSSFSAYSKSDFEGSSSASSASTDKLIEDSPVSNASSNHVTLESEVGGFSVATNSIQCKLSPERAKVAYESELHSRSPQEHVWEETMNDFENSYHIKEGSRVNVSSLGDGTNTMYSSQDGSTASNITTRRDSVHLLGISQILSESDDSGDHFRKMSPPNSVEAMSSNEVISTNTFTQKELESTNGEPVNVSDDSSDQSPKESHRHGCVIVNDLRDDLSFSDGNNSVKQSGDWSDVQIVSRNSSTSSNDDTSDSGFYDGFNDNSLSLSWISGENSAANIIEWAISQEISKGSI